MARDLFQTLKEVFTTHTLQNKFDVNPSLIDKREIIEVNEE